MLDSRSASGAYPFSARGTWVSPGVQLAKSGVAVEKLAPEKCAEKSLRQDAL
jgi:hypothetical protein